MSRAHDRVTVHDRSATHSPDAQDGALRWVKHWREPVHAKTAEIGHRERAMCKSSGASVPAWVLSASSLTTFASSTTPRVSAPRMTGTTKPAAMSMATPKLMSRYWCIHLQSALH